MNIETFQNFGKSEFRDFSAILSEGMPAAIRRARRILPENRNSKNVDRAARHYLEACEKFRRRGRVALHHGEVSIVQPYLVLTNEQVREIDPLIAEEPGRKLLYSFSYNMVFGTWDYMPACDLA